MTRVVIDKEKFLEDISNFNDGSFYSAQEIEDQISLALDFHSEEKCKWKNLGGCWHSTQCHVECKKIRVSGVSIEIETYNFCPYCGKELEHIEESNGE